MVVIATCCNCCDYTMYNIQTSVVVTYLAFVTRKLITSTGQQGGRIRRRHLVPRTSGRWEGECLIWLDKEKKLVVPTCRPVDLPKEIHRNKLALASRYIKILTSFCTVQQEKRLLCTFSNCLLLLYV